MSRPRLLRGLRIASSGWGGILCVLLIMLWVRSYSWLDASELRFALSRLLHIQSYEGRITVLTFKNPDDSYHLYGSLPSRYVQSSRARWAAYMGGTNWTQTFYQTSVIGAVSHWLAITILGAFVLLPWFGLQFSLRTLLIATTLIAVVLGLLVYSASS